MADWKNYYKVHSSRRPREQVVKAAALCDEKEQALDLGAGTLVESAFLLDDGFKKVTAVDSSEQARIFAKKLDPKRFTLETCSYLEFSFQENTYDLVNALYSLPFNGPDNFENLIEDIRVSLKPGGIFVGQLFGVRDGFNNDGTKLVFQTREEALQLLRGLDLIEFEEVENDGKTVEGTAKHWHVFHFTVRK